MPLLILIGNCRSGKSSYAWDWQHKSDDDNYKVVVNPDYIRIALLGTAFDPKQLDSPLDSLVSLITRVTVKSLYDQGYFVCVDSTNCYKRDIITWLKIDSTASFKFIDTPLEECLERGKKTGVNMEGIIRAVHSSLQELAWISKDNWENPPHSYLSWDSYLPLEERINKSVELLRSQTK